MGDGNGNGYDCEGWVREDKVVVMIECVCDNVW